MASEAHLAARANIPGHLNVLSIFATVDGECNGFGQGSMSVFIRLTGCRVGCSYCDTKYSWSLKQGQQMTPGEIVQRVKDIGGGISKVTITGGEPLEQGGDEFIHLLKWLLAQNYQISIETSGMLPFEYLANTPGIALVVDLKHPADVPGHQTPQYDDMAKLKSPHVIKVVITNADAFGWAILQADRLRACGCEAKIFFSPDHTNMRAVDLFELMLGSEECRNMNIGLNMQLHKYLFPTDFREEETLGTVIF